MSVFDEAPTIGIGETIKPVEATGTPTEDFLELVAKEKGDQWRDPQALAKGYVHAQTRIKELEATLKDAEMNTNQQDYAKELLAELKATQTTTGQVQPTEPTPSGESTPADEQTTLTPETIESLVEKTLTQRERNNTTKQNLAEVEKSLEEAFGTEASTMVKSKATELGLSLSKLQEIAGDSPSAFMALVGQPKPKETNKLPRSGTNTEAMTFNNPTGKRDFKYYNQLRRDNPRLYHTSDLRQQMMKDRIEMGESFFS